MKLTRLQIILFRRQLYAHRRELVRGGKLEEAEQLTRRWNLEPIPERKAA